LLLTSAACVSTITRSTSCRLRTCRNQAMTFPSLEVLKVVCTPGAWAWPPRASTSGRSFHSRTTWLRKQCGNSGPSGTQRHTSVASAFSPTCTVGRLHGASTGATWRQGPANSPGGGSARVAQPTARSHGGQPTPSGTSWR
jgi:hypothetical protein